MMEKSYARQSQLEGLKRAAFTPLNALAPSSLYLNTGEATATSPSSTLLQGEWQVQ